MISNIVQVQIDVPAVEASACVYIKTGVPGKISPRRWHSFDKIANPVPLIAGATPYETLEGAADREAILDGELTGYPGAVRQPISGHSDRVAVRVGDAPLK